jgi:hypothetical protein
MRHILILVVFLTSLSCNNTSSTLSKLENQSNYIEKEFDYLSQKITDYKNNNPGKWYEIYKKIVIISELTSEIEVLLNEDSKLESIIYQKIDDFFKSISDEEIEVYFQKLNQLEIDYWKSEFKEGQLLTDIEVELLLIKIKVIRNTLTKEYIENVNRLYYKFPIISPIVNAESNRLKLGESYKVEVSVGAFDPTIVPLCEIEGIKAKAYDGKFFFEIPCNKKGTFNWNGTLKMPGPQGHNFYVYPIEGQYSVK